MYYVYVLQSFKIRRFYIGVTKDLNQRILKHNNGSSSSTRPYIPWKLIYFEAYEDKERAYKREWYLKSPNGYLEKLEIVKQHSF